MNSDDIITEADGSVATIDAYDGHVEDGHKHGMTDKGYVGVALLLVLMAIKFVVVVSYFMHLKFDNKIFTMAFYTGLGLAVFVYVAALSTFHFFGS